MKPPSASPRPGVIIVWVVGIIAAAALGLTTYTLPSHSSAPYSLLAAAIHSALHDPPAPGPVTGNPVPVTADISDSVRAFVRAVAPTAEAEAPLIEPPPPDLPWAIEAAAADSAALRLWLSPAVLATGTIAGDTSRLILRRLFFHSGCPLLGVLHATYATAVQGELRLVRVVADCPPGPRGPER